MEKSEGQQREKVEKNFEARIEKYIVPFEDKAEKSKRLSGRICRQLRWHALMARDEHYCSPSGFLVIEIGVKIVSWLIGS